MAFTVGPVLCDDGNRLASVLQGRSCLFMCGHTQVHAVHLSHEHTHKHHDCERLRSRCRYWIACLHKIKKTVITLRI